VAKTEKTDKAQPVAAPKSLAEEKQQRFLDALDGMRKKYGPEAATAFGLDDETVKSVCSIEVIPTGILSVDRATRVGGIPRGRITEILGPESSGKTTLCLHTIAQAQAMGLKAAYVDLENALEGKHMKSIGINRLDIFYPETAEDALQMVEDLVKSNAVDIIVVDSVSAMSPKLEQEKSIGNTQPGRQAALMSEALRRLVGIIRKSRCAVVFINQLRMKIGVMYGNPETTSGGNALKFYASIRIDMRRKQTLKSGSEAYANEVQAKVIKNKVGTPFAEETFTMFYDATRTVAANSLEVGAQLGIVSKSGNWYEFNGEKLGNGLANSVEALIKEPKRVDAILKLCRDPKLLYRKTAAISNDVL